MLRQNCSDVVLRRVFGVVMFLAAIKMIFGK